MGTELPYIIKAQICFAAFWIAYRLLFARDKAFARNRTYLLLMAIAAFAIPALSIPVWTSTPTASSESDLQILTEVVSGIQPKALPQNQPKDILDGYRLLYYAAYTGSLIILLMLSIGGFRLWRITRRAILLHPGKIRIYRIGTQGSAFTLFNRIYINEQETKQQDIPQIVAHEMHHAKLYHSWDILLSSVLRILFWWNPFVWLWERSLREVHEFQADDAVLNNGFDSEQYISLILEGLTVIHPEFVSGFSYSLIKKRLIMIAQNKQKRRSGFRILLALPLTALLMVCFSFTERPLSASGITKIFETGQPYQSANDGRNSLDLSSPPQQTPSPPATGTNNGNRKPTVPADNITPTKNGSAPTSPAQSSQATDENEKIVRTDKTNEKNEAAPTIPTQQEQPAEPLQNALINTADTASRLAVLNRQTANLIKQINALAYRTAALNRQSANQTNAFTSRTAALNRQSANLSRALAKQIAELSALTRRDTAHNTLMPGERPIILIDGKEYDNIKNLDPKKVASVTVLKDAAAIAVFGVKGENGVIMIETKRDLSDETQTR